LQGENEISASTQSAPESERATSVSAKTWLKRLGFWGLVFFLVKGLLWLIIPALVAMFALE
jgi:hypothetical protein